MLSLLITSAFEINGMVLRPDARTEELAWQGKLQPARLRHASWCLHTHTQAAVMVQGMETALQRTGQAPAGQAGSGGVDKSDPDLVAYWTFDEGRGYVVHDSSGRGHDLFLTNEPKWQASRSLLMAHLNGARCKSATGRLAPGSSVR